jgi:hypothetical protein
MLGSDLHADSGGAILEAGLSAADREESVGVDVDVAVGLGVGVGLPPPFPPPLPFPSSSSETLTETASVAFTLPTRSIAVIGSSMTLGPVLDLSDSAIFAMAIANIIGLYILFPVVKQDLASYWARLQSGEIKRYRSTWLIHVD